MRLLLVRHGQSTWNATGRWQGWADPPLSRLGEAQAEEAAANLAELGVTGVASSDLGRARRTAEILAHALGVGAIEIEPGLREYDVGEWCGLTRPEIEASWPGLLADWHSGRLLATPGGETRAAFVDRALAAIARLMASDHLGERVVAVTHGGLVRAVGQRLGAGSESVANLGGRWIEKGADGELGLGEEVVLIGEDARTLSPSA